ncbi:hypothetical protein KIN20_021478 [Parelaphostrongylus tenuis]|uniref:Uncharacterized protein n=1 Tax=Parelaphostrongylus tenuis TaxID=148309 RepID=A0AAD5QRM1_PARTN|nr:hypothetical protein KIN20_021478 [Parelaphostrongylus tenuis]
MTLIEVFSVCLDAIQEPASSKLVAVTKLAKNTDIETKSICVKSNVDHFLGPKWADSLGFLARQSGLATLSDIVSKKPLQSSTSTSPPSSSLFASTQCKATRCQENKEEVDRLVLRALGLFAVFARSVSADFHLFDHWSTDWARRSCGTSIICDEN